jgi:hypothetical protein
MCVCNRELPTQINLERILTEHEAESLTQELLRMHGPLIAGPALWVALGFKSAAAFRQAKLRNHIEVKLFRIKNRRGHFALTTEIAAWLTKLQSDAQEADM